MKLTMGGGALAMSLAILCLTSGGAAAKDHPLVIGSSRIMEANFRGTKGFRFSLSASKQTVSLYVSGHHATVEYAVPGHASGKLIKARFGHLGRVSLRFLPSRKPHLLPKPTGDCSGGRELIQPGTFVGRVEFKGEQGYTTAHASRVKGRINHTTKLVCGNSESGGGGRSPLQVTILHAAPPDSGIDFSAFRVDSRSRPVFNGASFSASAFEATAGGMTISRAVEVNGKSEDFSLIKAHGKVVSATVTPPAPFTGSATYQRAPAPPSEVWTGSLAVELPGLGRVSLTGSDFCAETEVLAGCEEEGSSFWVVAVSGRTDP